MPTSIRAIPLKVQAISGNKGNRRHHAPLEYDSTHAFRLFNKVYEPGGDSALPDRAVAVASPYVKPARQSQSPRVGLKVRIWSGQARAERIFPVHRVYSSRGLLRVV
jgi:hypothetical protein